MTTASRQLPAAFAYTKDVDATLRIVICQTPGGATWAQISDAIRARFTVKNWVTEVRSRIQLLIDTGVIRRKAGSGITGPEAYEAAAKNGGPIL